jgi:ribonucleoside-diphosphate reductase alpha chain
VRMQAAFQSHTDNGVSKTVNFPSHATRDDVRSVYMLAYELGCKGVTVFRDGSRDKQVLNVGPAAGASAAGETAAAPILLRIAPRARPVETSGSTRRVKTGCGNLYVTVNADEKGPFELFTSMGKSGGCASAQSEAISRLVSLAMRAGVEMESITKHLRGIRCHLPVYDGGAQVLSCPDAIGIALQHAQRRAAEPGPALAVAVSGSNGGARAAGEALRAEAPRPRSLGAAARDALGGIEADMPAAGAPIRSALTTPAGGLGCPDCGSTLAHEGGCVACYTCGFSRCA